MASVPKSQYDDLQKRHENMRRNREREQRRASKLENENARLRADLKRAALLLDAASSCAGIGPDAALTWWADKGSLIDKYLRPNVEFSGEGKRSLTDSAGT